MWYWAIIIVILYLYSNKNSLEEFVPFNVFEAPSPDVVMENDRIVDLIQIINGNPFAIAHDLTQQINTFENVLNNSGLGRFTIISVQTSTQFSLINIMIKDENQQTVFTIPRVDFIVSTINGDQVISKILVSDPRLEHPKARDSLSQENMFRIKNPLHLFYPFATSDNDMIFSEVDQRIVADTLKQKSLEQATMISKDGTTLFK